MDDEQYADLVGIVEVAQYLRVPPSRVRRWIERRPSTNCPTPKRRLTCGDIYSLHEWRGWHALWRVTRMPQPKDPAAY